MRYTMNRLCILRAGPSSEIIFQTWLIEAMLHINISRSQELSRSNCVSMFDKLMFLDCERRLGREFRVEFVAF
jgi:hypothetical protein